jgi:hypothetical protein
MPPRTTAYRKLLVRDFVAIYKGRAMAKPSEMLWSAMAKKNANPKLRDACVVMNIMRPSAMEKNKVG